MQGLDVLRLTTGHRLSFESDGSIVEAILAKIEKIHVGPELVKFTIKFEDENSQQWTVTDQTKNLVWLSMPESTKKSLPMAKEPAPTFAFLKDDIKHSQDDLYARLIEEMIAHGVDGKVIAKAARSLAMKLDGKNDELELFCWRLFGKYSKADE